MQKFTIHVGKIVLHYDHSPVKASTILKDAGADPPKDFLLEELKHEGGPPVHEYKSDDEVDVREDKFFRVVPNGGGRA